MAALLCEDFLSVSDRKAEEPDGISDIGRADPVVTM